MQQALRISTPAQLASLLNGKSDGQIEAMITELGVDCALQEVFTYVVSRFLPDKGAVVHSVVIEWNLTTAQGVHTYQVTINQGVCTAEPGRGHATAAVVFTAELATFLRLICGLYNGIAAAARGEVQIEGDQTMALVHQRWFDFEQHKYVPAISSPRDLARLIEGRSNAEIDAAIAAMGVDSALEQLFCGLTERFLPQNGPRKRSIAEFVIHTVEGPRVYQIIADRRGITFRPNAPEKADFCLTAELSDLLRMGVGMLDALKAFMSGKIKIGGNLLLAATFPSWFDFSS